MHPSSEELFYRFTDLYESGHFLESLQTFLVHPDIMYDALSPTMPLLHYLVNYVDACVFYGDTEAQISRETLQDILESDPHLKVISDQFITILKDEQILNACYAVDPQMIEFQKIPSFYKPLIEQKVYLHENVKELIRRKPAFAQLLSELRASQGYPWHPFSYDLPLVPVTLRDGNVPLIFMESLKQVDYQVFLSPYHGRQVIYVFETVASFFQLVQWKEVVSALIDPKAVIYILELYPDEQFGLQDIKWDQTQTFQPILMVDRPILREVMPLLADVLHQSLSQTKGVSKHETSISNWLYRVAKRVIFRIRAERYGKSRCLALSLRCTMEQWHDSHKGLPPIGVDLGPLPRDYVGELLQRASQNRFPRPSIRKPKIRIAHVVPQIVDGGHAPSKLIRTLLEFSNPSEFDRFLIISEQLCNYPLEYPVAPYCSEPSTSRGVETLRYLQQKNVQIFAETPAETYELTAAKLAQKISSLEFDLVIFHGPDEINCLCSSSINVPIRVMFDHGTLPSYPCFDFVIVSSEDAFKRNQVALKSMGMESAPLHFSVDVRKVWKSEPYSKEELGFPADSFIMTTISHHLDARLSVDMCHAIGKILQRCLDAYYAPIGPVTQEEKFRTIFELYGVNDRVIFMGRRDAPSQYMRSMELYLNEFPFGSGLGILDAMAAGCPVVTMYDEEGPQQSRYGGIYFGIERAISNGSSDAYVDLACSLVLNEDLYKEWSAHALKQFEKHVDERAYVKNFENILKKMIG